LSWLLFASDFISQLMEKKILFHYMSPKEKTHQTISISYEQWWGSYADFSIRAAEYL
jgi:hypothetical protein